MSGYIFRSLLAIVAVLIICSCKKDDKLENALLLSGENRMKLECFLLSLEGDELLAGKFLVGNMPGLGSYEKRTYELMDSLLNPLGCQESWEIYPDGRRCWVEYDYVARKKAYDLESVSADYLMDNITRAIDDWRMRPWNKSMSKSDFMELLLPYRVDDEMMTDWRDAYKAHFGGSLDEVSDVVDAACIVAERLGAEEYRFNDDISKPHRDALSLLNIMAGNCVDDCDRTLYAMRACGIPVAIDGFLVSPDNGGSHRWNVLYDNLTERFIPFDVGSRKPDRKADYPDYRKKGKVYRYMYGISDGRKRAIEHHIHAPAYLKNLRMKDVTSEYFGHNRVDMDVLDDVGNEFYLGIFTPSGIEAVDFGKKMWSGKVRYEDLEPYVIYFPLVYSADKRDIVPCGDAFMVLEDGEIFVFKPDFAANETVKLTRKMPVRPQLVEWMTAGVVGMKIEGGDMISEEGWTTLYEFQSHLEDNFHIVYPEASRVYKYYKISPSYDSGVFQLAEIKFFSDEQCPDVINMPICSSIDEAESRVTDGDILSYYIFSSERNRIIFKNEDNKPVGMVALSARNDDNYVWPGQEYELLCYDCGVWKSLGVKTAQGHSVEFAVPKNAVLWLRNLTKGREEQVFVCVDGRQLFNMDLSAESFCGQK